MNRAKALLRVALLVSVFALSSSAYAGTTTTSIKGDVSTDATWTYYTTQRETAHSGQIELDLTNCTANTLKVYLRNSSGNQISKVQDWPNSSGGYRSFIKLDDTVTYPAGTQFRFAARLTIPIQWWEDNTWAANLRYQ